MSQPEPVNPVSPWPVAGPKLSEDTVTGNASFARMNQPWRAGVAVVEWIAAAALVALAGVLWQWGIVLVTVPAPGGEVEVITHMSGNWLTLAVLSVTIAGFCLLDSVREVLLALGTRRRRKARRRGSAESGAA